MKLDAASRSCGRDRSHRQACNRVAVRHTDRNLFLRWGPTDRLGRRQPNAVARTVNWLDSVVLLDSVTFSMVRIPHLDKAGAKTSPGEKARGWAGSASEFRGVVV